MRLKGGKVLLDLTSYVLSDDINHNLSKEEFTAILEKGVSILLKVNDSKVLFTPLIVDIESNYITYDNVTINGDVYDAGIQWNVESIILFISVQ